MHALRMTRCRERVPLFVSGNSRAQWFILVLCKLCSYFSWFLWKCNLYYATKISGQRLCADIFGKQTGKWHPWSETSFTPSNCNFHLLPSVRMQRISEIFCFCNYHKSYGILEKSPYSNQGKKKHSYFNRKKKENEEWWSIQRNTKRRSKSQIEKADKFKDYLN